MEKKVAILMADLSGYTALTETHGPSAAADLIDRYTQIVEGCLMGDCRLHERTGDEIMIVSASPDHLLATAFNILQHTCSEENFLLVHGGMHYGSLLQRGNSFFGTAINLTSRIAGKAGAGRVLCSEEFVTALADRSLYPLVSKGKEFFKNLNDGTELFELENREDRAFYIDPICRMLIVETKNAVPHPHEDGQYFCSLACLEMYRCREQ
jgi:class 3 adenylate cyclase